MSKAWLGKKDSNLPLRIQSFLPNPHQHLDSLSHQSIAELVRKDQWRHLCPAGFWLALSLWGQVYNGDGATDNGNQTIPLVGPLTLRETIVPTVPNNANETKILSLAPLTLPEYVVEVMP